MLSCLAKTLSMPGSQSLLDIDLVLAVCVRSFTRYFEGMNLSLFKKFTVQERAKQIYK